MQHPGSPLPAPPLRPATHRRRQSRAGAAPPPRGRRLRGGGSTRCSTGRCAGGGCRWRARRRPPAAQRCRAAGSAPAWRPRSALRGAAGRAMDGGGRAGAWAGWAPRAQGLAGRRAGKRAELRGMLAAGAPWTCSAPSPLTLKRDVGPVKGGAQQDRIAQLQLRHDVGLHPGGGCGRQRHERQARQLAAQQPELAVAGPEIVAPAGRAGRQSQCAC